LLLLLAHLFLVQGKNISDRSKGFQFGARVTFTDKAALGVYATHPEHVKFVELLKPLTDDMAVVDYEF